jgi:glycogen operon protein
MHVDGFRFDLAATLARELHEVAKLGAFFDIIHQDPIISRVKLIAEPWDVGEGGYQVGKFPAGWAEWNGLYRDCMRDFWRGEPNLLGEFAERITGSSDLYKNDYRSPCASINFITAHDGFTLHDLVSYNNKHNEANSDNNADGESHNRSFNYGTEGETDDAGINHIRMQQQKNFIATLMLSQGVPMLLAGDELGNTQHGNNNAYCQDNELSYVKWPTANDELIGFTASLIHLRKKHPSFSRRRWFQGQPIRGIGVYDIAWFDASGNEMQEEQWKESFARSLAVFYNGLGLRCLGPQGEKMEDNNFYLIFNAHDGPLDFRMPDVAFGETWTPVLDTANPQLSQQPVMPASAITVNGRSIVLLQAENKPADATPPQSLPELTEPDNEA